MILSVCPNPCIDVYYHTSSLLEDDTNRVENPMLSPGGKGVNTARVIARFCEDSYLALPLGGCTGECAKRMLEDEGVTCVIVETARQTRVNTILERKGRHILIASRGSPLTESEAEKLFTAVCGELEPAYIVLGGSTPPGLSNSFYAEVVRYYRGTNTKVVVDADGELLKNAVKAGPFAVKPNKHELERLAGVPLLGIDEVVEASKELLNQGVEVVLVSLGEYGAVCITSGGSVRVVPPKVSVKNTVGAGDAFVGGFVYALHAGRSLEDAVRFAVACGTATVVEEGVKLCTPAKVKEIYQKVKVLQL
jgi:1-phosphofructokinase family hexose kinase